MKKILTLFLAAMIACSLLTACNTETQPAANDKQTSAASEETAPAASDEAAPVESEEKAPVYGTQIADGTYPIDVTSSSSMFRVVDAQLTAEGGKMTAVLTLSGVGYEKLYMGTGEQALADTDDKCIYFVEDANGKYTYTVPVAALDQNIDCAAWSTKKQEWYDRVLVFESARIPAEKISAAPAAQLPADGQYTIDVTLSGGSGKTTVASPAKLTVADGKATATITWSSPNYDYMLVDGTKYTPVNTEGSSTFEIPVLLDTDMAVIADTIAMSTPHEIEYTLHFDSSTLTK